MALNITSNYQGDLILPILTPAIYEAKSIEKNYVTVHVNAKDKMNVPIGSSVVNIQDYACDPVSSGSFTLSEKQFDMNKFQVYTEVCFDDLRNSFYASQLKAGSLNDAEGASDVIKFITYELTKKVSKTIEIGIWSGALASSIEGFHALAVADAGATEITGTTITKANVIAELDKVIAAIPDSVYADTKIYVSTSTARLLQLALPEQYPYSFKISDETPLMFRGFELRVVDLAPNKMLASKPENLHLATDLLSDFNQFKSDFISAKSDLVFYKLQFKLDTLITNPTEIVVYN